jgi:cytochrome P450
MRIYPPAWMQGRYAVEAFELDGYTFPAGTMLTFSQWVMHRLPDIWGDPEVFRPERWDPVHGQKVPQWAYFPFGGGPRICIGMPFAQLEAKLLLVTVLQHYTPLTVPGYRVEPNPLITLRPKGGLPMRLVPTPKSPEATLTVWEDLVQVPAVYEDGHAERRGCRGAVVELFNFWRW